MISIAIHNRSTGATTGYLRLNRDHDRAHLVLRCDRASHFIGHVAAALVRDRFQPSFDDRLTVTECLCPTGLALAHELDRNGPRT